MLCGEGTGRETPERWESPREQNGSDLGLIVLGSKKGHGFGDGMEVAEASVKGREVF